MSTPSARNAGRLKRGLIVFDGSKWYVRRLVIIEHDLFRDYKIYHCDKPIGRAFTSLKKASERLEKWLSR